MFFASRISASRSGPSGSTRWRLEQAVELAAAQKRGIVRLRSAFGP